MISDDETPPATQCLLNESTISIYLKLARWGGALKIGKDLTLIFGGFDFEAELSMFT